MVLKIVENVRTISPPIDIERDGATAVAFRRDGDLWLAVAWQEERPG